jgi:exonuclease VII small subunit
VKKAKKGAEVDPADLERVEAELEKAQAQLADANKQLKVATTTAEKATKALEAEQGHTQKLLIENGLTSALTAAGVTDPDLLESAAALIQMKHKPQVVIEGDARVAKVGDKTLADFIKEWAPTGGKSFVAAAVNSGGGATGGKGGTGAVNPFDPATKNSTEQGKLYVQNPTLARQMALEHGITLE